MARYHPWGQEHAWDRMCIIHGVLTSAVLCEHGHMHMPPQWIVKSLSICTGIGVLNSSTCAYIPVCCAILTVCSAGGSACCTAQLSRHQQQHWP
jgi:hypothetical protein